MTVQSSFQLFEVLFTSIFDTSDPFTRIFSMIIMLFHINSYQLLLVESFFVCKVKVLNLLYILLKN